MDYLLAIQENRLCQDAQDGVQHGAEHTAALRPRQRCQFPGVHINTLLKHCNNHNEKPLKNQEISRLQYISRYLPFKLDLSDKFCDIFRDVLIVFICTKAAGQQQHLP